MNYMKEILSHIELRPNMILNECTLENLYAFINGYMYCIFQADDIVPDFYPGFQEYIEKIYSIAADLHWSVIINLNSKSEKEAFDKFFRHLEEYTQIASGGR